MRPIPQTRLTSEPACCSERFPLQLPARQGWLVICLLLLVYLATVANVFGSNVIIRAAYDHPAKRGKADLTNIVVWLTPLPASGNTRVESVSSELPHHFEMMQAHKRFVPHLLVVPVGSVVDFPNKDPFFHNVFSLFDGKRFDLGLYEAGGSRAIKFDRVGVSFLFCNIHPQMSGVVLTIATPYYGTSNDAGLVEIENVPAGKYRLEIWTE